MPRKEEHIFHTTDVVVDVKRSKLHQYISNNQKSEARNKGMQLFWRDTDNSRSQVSTKKSCSRNNEQNHELDAMYDSRKSVGFNRRLLKLVPDFF